MHRKLLALTTLALSGTFGVQAQNSGGGVPLYRVTVIERTVKAVNYQYRREPTQIDFRGTVLLPEAKGHAVVESKAGRTEIDAKFDRMRAPSRFGPEYLTYVLWAITPQGHAKNLGEVAAGHSDKASMHVSTDLQAFGLIVTAEPYAAVRQPSDVVVMENEIRPDTVGRVEQVNAKYELLPRGHYTYEVPRDLVAAEGSGQMVPMAEYEALLHIYEAQNAVQIARANGADQYAADTLHKAEGELAEAQRLRLNKADRSNIVMAAREAAQDAEDARAIAIRRKQDGEVAQAQQKAQQEEARRLAAEADARRAREEASADRMQLDQERAARQQAEAQAQAEAEAARIAAQQAQAQPAVPAPAAVTVPRNDDRQEKVALRNSLLQQLNATGLHTIDSPRGLVVAISSFGGSAAPLSRVAEILAAHPGLSVEVSGNCDVNSAENERVWRMRAEEVGAILVHDGVPARSVETRYYGMSRPLASNATAFGREQNRRVEITITGDAIGNQPYWDRSYSLVPRR